MWQKKFIHDSYRRDSYNSKIEYEWLDSYMKKVLKYPAPVINRIGKEYFIAFLKSLYRHLSIIYLVRMYNLI